VNDTTWFDFDRLTFDTNSATLSAQSQEQLGNIASILKAYPNMQIKIGGYTDNTGDYAANMQLSQQRADSVQQQLVGMGIAAERIQAEGYGPQHPIADNSTEAGRARNRRIALLVTRK
jgi:K(+)-stimulated pyrophosphate-energized sodium pump